MKFAIALVLAAALAAGQSKQPTTSSSPTIIKDPAAAVIRTTLSSVLFLRFSPNGRELATVNQFGPFAPLLYDTVDYNTARTFPIGMRMVAYSPDGTRIATAEGNDGARIWDATVEAKPLPPDPQGRVSPEQMGMVLRSRFQIDKLLTLDKPLRVLQAPSRDTSLRVFWTEFSPDGNRLVTTHANGHVKVWNSRSWAVERDLILTDAEVRDAVFTPDSKALVIGDATGVLHRWDFEKEAETMTTPTPNGAVTGMAFASDGKTLITVHVSASGPAIMIWDTASWTAHVTTGVSAAAFSANGKLLAMGGSRIDVVDLVSQTRRTIELAAFTMTEVGLLPANAPNADRKIPVSIGALTFSPDGSTLAVGCVDGTVRIIKSAFQN